MSAQKGFGLPAILIILGIVVIAGAFFFFQKSASKNSIQITQQDNKTDSSDFSFEISDKKLLLTGGFADPSTIKLKSGTHILYVNKFGGAGSANLIYTSKDGLDWQATNKKVPGGPTSRGFVTDERVRLYYPTQTPINPSDPPSQILSAISSDGLNFTSEEGIRMKPAEGYTIEGPSIIKIDNLYRMYFSEFKAESVQQRKGARIVGASSKDGLYWTRDEKPSVESDEIVEKSPSDWPQALRPFVLKRAGGGYIMFYNSHSKIFLTYSDDGYSWKKLGGLGIKGADVDAFYLPDDTIRIYYGDFSEATSGVVYTAILKEVKMRQNADQIMEAPQGNVKPLGSKPPPPPECVGKKAADPNLSESCKMWFKIQ